MKIYLIFECTSKKYMCVNHDGQTVPFQLAQNMSVDFLSRQMECFGNLKMEAFLRNGRAIILRDEQNNFFCSAGGNAPFMLTPLKPAKEFLSLIERFEKFTLSTNKIPAYTSINLKDQMVQRLKTSWGTPYSTLIEQHRNDKVEDMINNMSKIDLRGFSKVARWAMNKEILERKTQAEDSCIDIAMLYDLVKKQNGDTAYDEISEFPFDKKSKEPPKKIELIKKDEQEPFFGICEEFFKYEANQECMDAFHELGKQLIQQGCEPQAKSISPKRVSQLQKQSRRM